WLLENHPAVADLTSGAGYEEEGLSMDNLLVRDYDALSIEERARAIEEARRIGWECAQAYASAHDDEPGSLVVEPRDYIPYVVEVAYATEQCSEATLRSWEEASNEELESDPRVQAFMRAWNEEAEGA